MDPIGTLAVALVGVAMVGGWIGWSRHVADRAAELERNVQARASHTMAVGEGLAVLKAASINGWTGKPSTVGLPRVARYGFGVRITHAPARARRFSTFAYPGMWAGLHR